MFKERILAYRTHRLSKRSFSSSVREEAGYNNSDGNATTNTVLSKHELRRLYRNFVQLLRGKNNHEHLFISDGSGGSLELGDNEIRSIESELTNLSLQLGLYLDAGLVVSAAFDEIINQNSDNEKILYKVLNIYNNECKINNNALINELLIFSQYIKSKAMMRFTSLVLDNKSKGNALADKLDKEREQMQNARLSLAKAKAKEAETKLCFPLMLLLISLIIICSAPALMQM